ncbi:hypothetical protein FK85_22930 [Halorubrum saccharovorum]|uniref:Uncharacterized protein n=1 Tax=Halorubrum saccharovorum TaxID=2248 RepID=A0A0F8D762_9EURY|nr:hypothetical protein [Halorubrum saccharovorum]KKF40129.1 hypothetical protein FK85_22930 [Halorubrum saccharovorum]
MSYVPLSDDETRVIFTSEARSNLAGLEGSEQQAILKKILSVLQSESPPSSFVREEIQNLDIIAIGSQIRLYSKVVERIPRGNAEFDILYIFYIDDDHDYEQRALATYSYEAQAKMESLTSLETVFDVQEYFEEMNALDEGDIRDLLDA